MEKATKDNLGIWEKEETVENNDDGEYNNFQNLSTHACMHNLHVLNVKFSIVKTQRNSTSTQLKATQKQLRWVRYPPHPTINFSVTSSPARELKFGTDTH